jgi:hypothetical protein
MIRDYHMKCANCGAPFDKTSSLVKCPYCGGLTQTAPVVLAQSLRIETINETATAIIHKWSALPTSFIADFSTALDNQQAVSVHILQGDGEKITQNRDIGLFTFDGIPPAPRAEPRIQFRFEVNEDGVLVVTAENQSTGKKVTFPSMQLDILKKTMGSVKQVNREVKIIYQGRSGHIQFIENRQIYQFDWEYGDGDIILTVWVPSDAQWAAQYPLVKGRRQEILTFLADEARAQSAPSSTIVWETDRFHLMKSHNVTQSAPSGMTLECANSKPIQNPVERDIDWLFADDKARGDFVILSHSAQYYVQVAGEGSGPYILECRAGDKEHHFRCPQNLSKQAVQTAFLKYLRLDPSFTTDFIWEKVEL